MVLQRYNIFLLDRNNDKLLRNFFFKILSAQLPWQEQIRVVPKLKLSYSNSNSVTFETQTSAAGECLSPPPFPAGIRATTGPPSLPSSPIPTFGS
jgi:hypothetical protein